MKIQIPIVHRRKWKKKIQDTGYSGNEHKIGAYDKNVEVTEAHKRQT